METTDFVKNQILIINNRIFIGYITTVLIGYVGLTYLLNAIRTTIPSWILWILIVIQFLLYCSIFSISYDRAKHLGLKLTSPLIFIILGFLGRVNDWELAIIPLLVIIMLILSFKSTVKLTDQNI